MATCICFDIYSEFPKKRQRMKFIFCIGGELSKQRFQRWPRAGFNDTAGWADRLLLYYFAFYSYFICDTLICSPLSFTQNAFPWINLPITQTETVL